MNILLTLNSKYALYATVMLTSLIENNDDVSIDIYIIYRDLDEFEKNLLSTTMEKRKNNGVHFIYVSDEMCKDIKGFSINENLTAESLLILICQDILPVELDRILYLDGDLIVDGNISNLYYMDFEDKYLVVAGQSHKMINGHLYCLGARPKYGECFDSGMMLLNLDKMRQNMALKACIEKAIQENNDFTLTNKGVLNLAFYDKARYVDTLKYNFRMNIYHDLLEEDHAELSVKPLIIHFASQDFYNIGYATKPWICTLLESEYNFLESIGKVKRYYGMDEWVKKNKEIHEKFWKYAHLSGVYEKLYKAMIKSKESIIKDLCEKKHVDYVELHYANKKMQEVFTHLSIGEFSMISEELHKYTYKDLEQYIDMLAPEKAKETLQNLHKHVCEKIAKKEKILVGFLVYSSAEWQCDKLYWLLENDDRFIPVILICGYGHGTMETIKDTYKKTCRYFQESSKLYRVRYGGCLREMYKDSANDFDILVYITPFSSLCPISLNFINRNLNQLGVHIPYGIYMAEKNITYYKNKYYDMPIFKMGWRYFCEDFIQENEVKKVHRLNGVNIVTTGHPKIDELLDTKTYNRKCDRWKCGEKTRLKIIWAPHFNMTEGMNGTFFMNYQWFYEYASKHQDISWIVRPHPRMRIGVKDAGVFRTLDEYEDYMHKWDSLPNGRVIDGGGYYDFFVTSDALILDSLSFVAEYMYTGKPILKLVPRYPRPLNKLGRMLDSVISCVSGDDYESIEGFIEDVKKGIDNQKEKRMEMFRKTLDYYSKNGKTATNMIYDELCTFMN